MNRARQLPRLGRLSGAPLARDGQLVAQGVPSQRGLWIQVRRAAQRRNRRRGFAERGKGGPQFKLETPDVWVGLGQGAQDLHSPRRITGPAQRRP